MALTVEERAGGEVAIRIEGCLDMMTSTAAREAIFSATVARPSVLIVEMDQVTYIDTAGIAILIETLHRVRTYGGKLLLPDPSATVQEVLSLSRLTAVFDTVEPSPSPRLIGSPASLLSAA